MPAPTSMTEAEFRAYLHQRVSEASLASVVRWEGSDPVYADIVADTLLALGATTVASFAGSEAMQRLRAAGRVILWRRVAAALTTAYNFSTANGSYSRAQMREAVAALVAQAESDAAAAGATGVLPSSPPATLSPLAYPHDPYGPGLRSVPWHRRSRS